MYKNFGECQMYSQGAFWGNTPKLVEWVHFKNFGFKVNVVTKHYQSETNALPNNVNGGEFVERCST